jgi:hypothetical protein
VSAGGPVERLLRDRTTRLSYRLGNLRDGLLLLLELVGPRVDRSARWTMLDRRSEPAVARWESELIMVGWWVSFAALRLLDQIDCPELACLNASRCQLLARAASLLRGRGRADEAAAFLMLHDLDALPDWMRIEC